MRVLRYVCAAPIDADTWAKDCVRRRGCEYKLSRSSERTGTYAAAGVSLAHKLGIDVIDTWTAFQQHASNWKQAYLSDGLHFSAAGDKVRNTCVMCVCRVCVVCCMLYDVCCVLHAVCVLCVHVYVCVHVCV